MSIQKGVYSGVSPKRLLPKLDIKFEIFDIIT